MQCLVTQKNYWLFLFKSYRVTWLKLVSFWTDCLGLIFAVIVGFFNVLYYKNYLFWPLCCNDYYYKHVRPYWNIQGIKISWFGAVNSLSTLTKDLARCLSASGRGVSRAVNVANPVTVFAVMWNWKPCFLLMEANPYSALCKPYALSSRTCSASWVMIPLFWTML